MKGTRYRPRVPKEGEEATPKYKKPLKVISTKPIKVVMPEPGLAKPEGPIPPDIAAAACSEGVSPLEFMLSVMRDDTADVNRRDRMALAAAPFIHPRAGDKGKKDEKEDRAKAANSGKFAPSKPPALKAVK